MTKPIVIVGAGGFGREVIDVVDAINAQAAAPEWEIVGVVDDSPTEINLKHLERRGTPFLGGTEKPFSWPEPVYYVVGIGNPRVRRLIADRYDAAHLKAATLVHPAVTQGFDVRIGAGSVVCAGVRLTTNISLGRHVHLNLNVTVGHDTTLEDFVSVNPLASISGDCVIEDDVLVGVAGVVLNGLTVGRGATVGGSACVVRDVTPGLVVKGVPAK
ncbi:acetyltransferase [Nocardioides ganghwensis]|uniref:Acetyltransferase n=1 Tax=Nocardioides ganghwensis TaxID=252230 RepID=A0A4Q2SDH8_9ACTN|nr:acetyltransferase [Nocardioides ganghwensis]MBD3947184.1 acetyltransferase [Nocardioides ganghwensis]RYC00690.1 acetyltransferase [Nocardioides ganghwensis]